MNTFLSHSPMFRLSLLTATLIGCLDDADPNVTESSDPAPIHTLAAEDLTLHEDGCRYGTSSYSLTRENRDADLLVAIQTSCPADYFIEGTCSPRFTYLDTTDTRPANPILDDVCFHPDMGPDYGLEACQLGALVCAVQAPADRTEEIEIDPEDDSVTTQRVIYGPDLIDMALYFRCCPSNL